jgi:hypothetical protein
MYPPLSIQVFKMVVPNLFLQKVTETSTAETLLPLIVNTWQTTRLILGTKQFNSYLILQINRAQLQECSISFLSTVTKNPCS